MKIKYMLFFAFATILFASCSGGGVRQTLTDAQKDNLKGDVSEVTEMLAGGAKHRTKYNKDGYYISKEYSSAILSGNRFRPMKIFTYHDGTNKLKEVREFELGQFRTQLLYDENGFLKEEINKRYGASSLRNKADSMKHVNSFKTNEYGEVIEKHSIDGNYTTYYERDNAGNIVKELMVRKSGQENEIKNKYEYNNNEQLLVKYLYYIKEHDEYKTIIEYEYSDDNLIKSRTEYSMVFLGDKDPKKVKNIQYFYDSYGNITGNNHGIEEMTYDKHNNWIAKRYKHRHERREMKYFN